MATNWPCPFTLPPSKRPAWALPPDGPEGTDPCTFGAHGLRCAVPGCACWAMSPTEGLCEGHWLDTK